MEWKIDNNRPIYIQLVEQIQTRIVAGIYLPGKRLETVRELAAQAKVNPNTMQRALTQLERLGLVYSQRTSGRFITEDEELIGKMRREIAAEQVKEFIFRMKELGFKAKEIEPFIQSVLSEIEKEKQVKIISQ